MPGGSGSHWSLLLYLYVSESNEFLHFDSLGCANQSHAQKISKSLQTVMNKELNSSITAVRVPQQSDGVDCGMYLLIFTELLKQRIMQENHFLLSLQSPFPNIERSALILKRVQLAMLYFNSEFHQEAKTTSEMMIET